MAFIRSEIDLVVLPLAISFIIRTFRLLQDIFHALHCSTNYETNSVGHLFYRGMPGF